MFPWELNLKKGERFKTSKDLRDFKIDKITLKYCLNRYFLETRFHAKTNQNICKAWPALSNPNVRFAWKCICNFDLSYSNNNKWIIIDVFEQQIWKESLLFGRWYLNLSACQTRTDIRNFRRWIQHLFEIYFVFLFALQRIQIDEIWKRIPFLN